MLDIRKVSILSSLAVIITFVLVTWAGYTGAPNGLDNKSCAVIQGFYNHYRIGEADYYPNELYAQFENPQEHTKSPLRFYRDTGKTETYETYPKGTFSERPVLEHFETDIPAIFEESVPPEMQNIRRCFWMKRSKPKFSEMSYGELADRRKRPSGDKDKYINKWELSKPLFSRDGTRALVHYQVECGGLCGGGAIDLFKLIDGQWQFHASHSLWVS